LGNFPYIHTIIPCSVIIWWHSMVGWFATSCNSLSSLVILHHDSLWLLIDPHPSPSWPRQLATLHGSWKWRPRKKAVRQAGNRWDKRERLLRRDFLKLLC
jgi:hypothetical protein